MKSCTGMIITGSGDHWCHQIIRYTVRVNITDESSTRVGPPDGRARVAGHTLAHWAGHPGGLDNGEVGWWQCLWYGDGATPTVGVEYGAGYGVRWGGWQPHFSQWWGVRWWYLHVERWTAGVRYLDRHWSGHGSWWSRWEHGAGVITHQFGGRLGSLSRWRLSWLLTHQGHKVRECVVTIVRWLVILDRGVGTILTIRWASVVSCAGGNTCNMSTVSIVITPGVMMLCHLLRFVLNELH